MIPSIISIDPGSKGGFTVLVNGDPVEYHAIPYRDFEFSKNLTKIVDTVELHLLLTNMLFKHDIDYIVLEKPIALPQNAIMTTATSFLSYGAIIATLDRIPVPLHLLDASRWVKAIHTLLLKDKQYLTDNTKAKTKECFKLLWTSLPTSNDAYRDSSCMGFYWLWSTGKLSKV